MIDISDLEVGDRFSIREDQCCDLRVHHREVVTHDEGMPVYRLISKDSRHLWRIDGVYLRQSFDRYTKDDSLNITAIKRQYQPKSERFKKWSQAI